MAITEIGKRKKQQSKVAIIEIFVIGIRKIPPFLIYGKSFKRVH